MSTKENRIEQVIREYLLDEVSLKKIPDPKLEFGYQFTFPPGKDPSGRSIGQNMAVLKPKNKGILIISLGTQISPPHVEALNSLEDQKKRQFFIDLQKFLFFKNLLFHIDGKNNRYEISEQVFLGKKSVISKDAFFKKIRKVFSCSAYCQIMLNDHCSGMIKPEDIGKSRDFTSGSGFSLYS